MPEFDYDAALSGPDVTAEHGVAVSCGTYEVGEDGEEAGDAEYEWIHTPEDPFCLEPDEFDLSDGKTSVDRAVEYLRGEGATEASASHFHPGVWYICNEDMNGRGEVRQNTYHLKNFTTEEQAEVFRRVTGRGWVAQGQPIAGRMLPPRPA